MKLQEKSNLKLMQKINRKNQPEIISENSKYVHLRRPDGLNVFLDKNPDDLTGWLNNIRKTGTKQQVIQATGIIRGMQIAQGYARREGVIMLPNGRDSVLQLFESNSRIK